MKKRYFHKLLNMKSLLIFLMAGIFSGSAMAQKQYNLRECVNIAIEQNRQLLSMDYNVENAELSLKQSRHARYPNLNFSANLSNNFGRTIDPTSNAFITQSILSNGFNLSSGVLLFNGFRIQNTIEQSKHSTLAWKKDREQLERDISLNVASAYLNVLFAKENIAIAEKQLAQTISQRELVEKMIRIGNSPDNAIFDLDAQVAQNEQSAVTARNSLDLAMLTLRQLMRLDPNIPLDIVTPPVTITPDYLSVVTFDEILEKGLANQVGLEAARLRVDAAMSGEKVAAAGYYPSISAGGNLVSNFSNRFQQVAGYETRQIDQEIIFNGQNVTIGFVQEVPLFEPIPYLNQLNNNLSYGVGVSLSMPIYSNYSVRASAQRAKINTATAQNNYEIQRDNAQVTITQAYTEARAAQARYDASMKSLAAQEKVYDAASKRFETGALNSYDLVRFKTLLDNAQSNALIAKYDLFFRLKVLDFYLGRPIVIE